MAKARFGFDVASLVVNLALTATLTASSEVTNRPAAFLKNPARWKRWRSSTTTGDQNVVVDFGATKTVKLVALVDWKRHGTTGTIRADYWDGAAWQTFAAFTLPSFNPTRVVAAWNTSGFSTSKIRVYFTNVGAVSDYVELGKVVVNTYLEPTFNLVDGFELTPVDPSQTISAVGGEESGESRRHYFVGSGTFEHMPDADMQNLLTLYDTVGTITPVLVAINPDVSTEILYARILECSIAHAGPSASGSFWDITVALRESL